MPASERVIADVVRGWVEKAENDLKTAAVTLRAGEDSPTDTVAFHAQQCVEKYLKALLTLKGIDFPKIHDIEELVARVGPSVLIGLSVQEQRRLTAYGTVTRYPGDYEPISVAEARRAVALARRVRKEVRRELPRTAVRRRKRRPQS
ncbi:MAG TPA: HEPN domain-containing protein [Thermoanaerobaculia bacterium]|nr:HEPN domain-containing protein [Thermoanaerobaculia bacterium]